MDIFLNIILCIKYIVKLKVKKNIENCIFEQHGGCLIRNRNCLPFMSTWVHSRVFWWVCVAHLFMFLCCPIMCLYVLKSPVVMSVTISVWKRCSLPPVVCRREHVLFTLCVCLRMVMSNIGCVMFLSCVSSSCIPNVNSFSGLSLLDCRFGIL